MRETKKSSCALYAVATSSLKEIYVFTWTFTIKLISAKSAWSVLKAKEVSICTWEFTREKSPTRVLLAIKDFFQNPTWTRIRQCVQTAMWVNSSVIYAEMTDILELKMHCRFTCCFIMNQNFLVLSVGISFILRQAWTNI